MVEVLTVVDNDKLYILNYFRCLCQNCYCIGTQECEYNLHPCCVSLGGDSRGLHLPKLKELRKVNG